MVHSRRTVFTGFLTFLLPAALFLYMCADMGFAPFGNNSILTFDLSNQFVEFLCGLKHGTVFFSWSAALGSNYIGTFSYYLSSPLSILTLLCPDESMPIAVVFLAALKLGLCGFTFGLLLRQRTRRYDLTTAAFSLCYGLMAYNIIYSISFMWLDGVFWLPVLLLGVEHLLKQRHPWLLVFGLTMSFLSTWYISYMTGLFCVLYLLWRCGCEQYSWKQTMLSLLQLAARAALALLLTAWLWLPTFLSMLDGKLTSEPPSFAPGFTASLPTLLKKLLISGSYDSITYTGSAYLYCSLLAIILAIVWFVHPVSLRAKLFTFIFAGFLLFSAWFQPLDTIWHLFQRPNSFPGRWTFLISCFLLILAYDTLLWLLHKCRKPGVSTVLSIILLLVLMADMCFNGIQILHSLDEEEHFETYASYHDYKQMLNPLVERLHDDNTFVRTGADLHRSLNEAQAFGYNGLTFFSSSYNAAVNDMLFDLGYAQAWFWSTSFGSTPVSDLLLNIGWQITDAAAPLGYTLTAQSGTASLYQNQFQTSVGYLTETDLNTIDWDVNCFERQNQLLSALSGVDTPVFRPLDTRSGDNIWTVVSDGKPIYALFPQVKHAQFYVNDTPLREICDNQNGYIHALGIFAAGETVELRMELTSPMEYHGTEFYSMDMQAFKRAQAALQGKQLQVTGFHNGYLEGTVTASADGCLFTSIPAISGWTVKIDGKKVQTGTFRDTLLTIPVSSGTHTITLHYTPPGLIAGFILLGVGILWILLRMGYSDRKSVKTA